MALLLKLINELWWGPRASNFHRCCRNRILHFLLIIIDENRWHLIISACNQFIAPEILLEWRQESLFQSLSLGTGGLNILRIQNSNFRCEDEHKGVMNFPGIALGHPRLCHVGSWAPGRPEIAQTSCASSFNVWLPSWGETFSSYPIQIAPVSVYTLYCVLLPLLAAATKSLAHLADDLQGADVSLLQPSLWAERGPHVCMWDVTDTCWGCISMPAKPYEKQSEKLLLWSHIRIQSNSEMELAQNNHRQNMVINVNYPGCYRNVTETSRSYR